MHACRCMNLLAHLLTHLFTFLLTHLLTHTVTYSLTHSLTHSHSHSLTYSLTHYLTHSHSHLFTHLLTHTVTYLLICFRGLANSLSASVYQSMRDLAVFRVSIELTEAGVTAVDDVITCLFSYIGVLIRSGPQAWILTEVKNVKDTSFR
jgi:secreted Zn-dependent insulinase-like peptidase